MRKFVYSIIAMPMLAFPAAALADDSGRFLAHASGTVQLCVMNCQNLSSLGLECPANQAFIAIDITASFWRGICDNFGAPSCDDRKVTIRDEECLLPPTNILWETPSLQATIGEGIFELRISDRVVASGSSRAQTRTPLSDGIPLFTSGTVELGFERGKLGIDAIVGEFTVAPCEPGIPCGIAVTFTEAKSDGGDDEDHDED